MNDPIEDQIKNSMDELTNAIDVDTQVKLNEARFQALQQQSRPNLQHKLQHRLQRWLWPLAGTGVLMLLLLTVMPNMMPDMMPDMMKGNPMQAPQVVLFEDVEFLAENAGTEFYEDLEFLAWLDDQQLLESEI